MANISFLIGSGFSKPADLPMTSDLNKRLGEINSSEIRLHPNGVIEFLNSKNSPYAELTKIGYEERTLIQRFLEFYNKNILDKNESFHYEKFYDYYQGLIDCNNYQPELGTLFSEFANDTSLNIYITQFLVQFDNYFNQLLRNLLNKKFCNSHLCTPYSSNCSAFLLLLDELSQLFTIHIHSLNHDLYIEHLSSSDSILSDLTDGFEEVGSPYYGKFLWEESCAYNVRLSRFVNYFSSKIRLYKLHGSIDNYWFGNNNDLELIKLKDGIIKSRNGIQKEIEENGKKIYISESLQLYPDFLSGIKSKIDRYDKGKYYPVMFKHFENNLNNSDNLIVIGYGFRDTEINRYIYKFCQNRHKKIFIVDISQPDVKLCDNKDVIFISGGVVNMDYKEILSKVF